MEWPWVFTSRPIGPLKLFYHLPVLQPMFSAFLKGWQSSLGWSAVVRNKSIQISVPKSTQCSQHTSRDRLHKGPSPPNTLRSHLRQLGVQGSLEHGPFPSCSVLGLEHNIQFVWPCFTFLRKISSVLSPCHRASCRSKREEKKNSRWDRCELQRTEGKGAE